MKKLSSACTLDCFDCCRFNVYVEDDIVKKVEGDKEHPYTKGFICPKGLKHLERHNHPKRQYKPLIKEQGKWKEISFEKAIELMSEKLKLYRDSYGTESVLYYEQYGSGSLLKSIGEIFFIFFGGCSRNRGCVCWGAGIEAQNRNFGDVKSHSLEDLYNSKTIIVWGKNPAETTIHTMNMIKKAQKNGSYVIVIDPIETSTAKQADFYVRVKPDGDAALAFAIGKMIIEKGKCNNDYIEKYVNGFEAYKQYVNSLDMDMLCRESGVTEKTVEILAEKYTELYSTILCGHGLQRYVNGGNTIMAIDALGAITGQIGQDGGGVNYANKVYPGILNLDPYNSSSYGKNRFFNVNNISSFIKDNKIKMAVITKSNFINQLPDLNNLKEAFEGIEFKVCFDLFLTDTAKICDLFIPVTSVFESEDIIFSSMTNPYLTYIEKAVEPENELMDEYGFFKALAEKMELKNYPKVSKKEYLTKVIEPLKEMESEMSLDFLKDNYFTIHESVAWKDKKFKTPSGRFEIYFNESLFDKKEINNNKYGFRLITTHGRESISSQHFMDEESISKGYINNKMAKQQEVEDGMKVIIESENGKITAMIKIDDSIGDNIVMMHSGAWKKQGNPNYITSTDVSDIGGQIAYNDTYVKIQLI